MKKKQNIVMKKNGEKEEHKENMPPFSIGDEAEPRVGMGTPKLLFGTGLCQKKRALAQVCASFFTHWHNSVPLVLNP